MPFDKGNTMGASGRPKGPAKRKLSGYITNFEKLDELIEATGWNQGELLDMLIMRASVKNIKVKK